MYVCHITSFRRKLKTERKYMDVFYWRSQLTLLVCSMAATSLRRQVRNMYIGYTCVMTVEKFVPTSAFGSRWHPHFRG